MKRDIHPKYYYKAKVTCQCGNTFITGSTKPELHVDICSACHPFFTGGGEQFINRGRVDRFRAKVAAAQAFREKRTRISSEKTARA